MLPRKAFRKRRSETLLISYIVRQDHFQSRAGLIICSKVQPSVFEGRSSVMICQGTKSHCQDGASIISWDMGLIDEFPAEDGWIILVGYAIDAIDPPNNSLHTAH